MRRAQFLAGISIGAIALAFPAMSDAPKAPPQQPVAVPYEKACEDMELTVYFSSQETVLSSYSMRALNTAGDRLALVKDRDLAFIVARQNDLAPVSVH